MQIYKTTSALEKAALPQGDVVITLDDSFGGGMTFYEVKASGTGVTLPNGNVAVPLTYKIT